MHIQPKSFISKILTTCVIASGMFLPKSLFAATSYLPAVIPSQPTPGLPAPTSGSSYPLAPLPAPTGGSSTSGPTGGGAGGTAGTPTGGNTGGQTGGSTGSTTGGTTGGQTGGNNGGNTGGATNAAKGWKGMSTAQRAMGVLGAAGGAYGIYESTKGQGEHGVMNVVGGTASGAIMGASIGSMVPVIGTAIGAAGGAVIGGVISGSQLFSETDCLTDPVTGKFTCCNTVFNKGEEQVQIGGFMFCGDSDGNPLPGVRQCLQGGEAKTHGWWDSIWKDDEWEKECKPKWCDGYSEPASGTDSASIQWFADIEKICWAWDCADGYTKTNNTCVQGTGYTASNPESGTTNPGGYVPISGVQFNTAYDKLIQKIKSLQQQLQQECGGVI